MADNLKVKSILITQDKPENGKSIYDDLVAKYKLKIDYRSFTNLEALPAREIRRQKIDILAHTAVLFNSKNAVDHFFRIVDEMRLDLPSEIKYFCLNESITAYIQKYTQLRKRKTFTGTGSEEEFVKSFKNHQNEKFLFPCSDIRKPIFKDYFTKAKIHFTEAVMYRTVASDLSDLENVFYDVIVFFTPVAVKSLYENFPNFKQKNTRLAAFGATTQKALQDYDLSINIPAPTVTAPSMVNAIEQYIKTISNGK